MEIMELIREYETGEDFTPLEINMEIKPPVYLSSPYLHFDSIINYLCFRDCLNDEFYTLPSDKLIDTSELKIPLMKTEDVYHGSIGIFKEPRVVKDIMYKRFSDKEINNLTSKKNQGRVLTDRGHFKDFIINLPAIITKHITFYCNGDKQELERLLSHFTMIGKKTSVGSGRVLKSKVKKIDEDYSFFKDKDVMRTIPTSLKIPIFKGVSFQKSTYKPPYWYRNHAKRCVVPKNQFIENVL